MPYIKTSTAEPVETDTACKMSFSTGNSFHYGLPSADSWQCDLFPLLGLRWTERSGLMLRPPSSPLPHFRGNCGRQVRILFLSDLLAAWHMTSAIHTNTTTDAVCVPKHTHTRHQAAGIYLCDELILSERVDPASVTLSRSLWKPLNFTANQLP